MAETKDKLGCLYNYTLICQQISSSFPLLSLSRARPAAAPANSHFSTDAVSVSHLRSQIYCISILVCR